MAIEDEKDKMELVDVPQATIYQTSRSLPVRLTQDELLEVAVELARSSEEVKDIENKKKEVNAQFTAELTKAKADIEISSRMISTGEEYRAVECDVVIDINMQRKRLVRTDTGAVLKEEKLTTEDLQMELQTCERKSND